MYHSAWRGMQEFRHDTNPGMKDAYSILAGKRQMIKVFGTHSSRWDDNKYFLLEKLIVDLLVNKLFTCAGTKVYTTKFTED